VSTRCVRQSRSGFAPVYRSPLAATVLANRFFSGSAFQYILSEQKDNTVYITFNRPELHNAFDEVVIEEVTRAFQQINPESARSVVLRANGQSFSAGADLNWMKKMAKYSEAQNAEDSQRLFEMVYAIKSCPLPVIARVNGGCFGGGGGIVAACDMAFALNTAKFGFTEAGLGLVPAVISRFVMDKIGQAQCSRLFLTAERFDAQLAKSIGLVNDVAESDEALDALVSGAVKKLNGNSPAAVRASKQLIKKVSGMTVEESKPYVTQLIASVRVSKEGQEGLTAFFEKRKPAWLAKKE